MTFDPPEAVSANRTGGYSKQFCSLLPWAAVLEDLQAPALSLMTCQEANATFAACNNASNPKGCKKDDEKRH